MKALDTDLDYFSSRSLVKRRRLVMTA